MTAPGSGRAKRAPTDQGKRVGGLELAQVQLAASGRSLAAREPQRRHNMRPQRKTQNPHKQASLSRLSKLALAALLAVLLLQTNSDTNNGGQFAEAQASLLNSIYLPSSSAQTPSILRRDLSAKHSAEAQQLGPRQRASGQLESQPTVCQVRDGESVAIVEIEESRASDMSQNTNPLDLPISGSVGGGEIELKIESATHKYFQIQDKRLRLTRPLDRDAVLKENSTQILQQPISSIYLQISCLDKRAEGGNGEATKQSRKVIIPVLVKVLDLNDNAPKFSSPIYTVSVNELTPLDSIVIDSIQAVDLDSANNGLVEYSLAGAMTTTEPKDPVESNLSPQARLVQRAQPETQAVISTAAPSATLPTVSGEPQIRGSTANGGLNLEPSNDLPATESAVSAIVNSTSKSEPTINLESEPILNGPVEEGEEEESDESLLASMNSTDSEADFDSAILTRATARRSRRRRRHSVSFRQHTPATTSNPEFSSSSTGARLAGETTKSRDLWTNLLAASAGDEMLAAERYNGLELANGLGATNNKLTEATFADEHFALELAPHTNRPVIRLKKQLDYESKRVHLLTIRATDMAPNKQERLSSMATIVVRVLDGDDQGPAFVLDQGGCATGSVPQTTASSLLVAPDRWPQGASVGGEQLQEAESMVSTSGQVVAPKSRPAANPGDQALDLGGSNSPTRATTKLDRHLPKGFRVTEDNFEFGDSSSSDDSDGDHQLLSAIHQPETWGQAGRARRFPPLANAEANSPAQTTRAPPATRSTKSRQPDYTCLSSSPVLSGQAEYFATVMSGDSDYLLRIAPQAIRARDRDELNAPIRYSFVNGTPNHFGQYFQINPLDASIKQVAPVDRAQVGKFIIWIQAQEQNANKLSSTAKLTIDVIPTDKNPPVLVPNSYSGFIEENSPIGSNVAITADPKSRNTSSFLRINVVDADYSGSSQANPVTIPLAQLYEFDTTSDAFKVDKEGFLYVNQWPLDRDPPNQEVHIFQVTARQIGLASSRSISSPVSINVTLLDLNDNPPLISNASLVQLQLAATNGATRTLTTIKTTDKDLPENAKVHFSIHHVSNNGRDRFRINEESGELQALGKFNSGEQFSITVQVSDDLGRSSQGILDMLVVPGPNTGGPQFVVDSEHDNSRGYSVEVNEGVAPHSAILQVQARDPENDPIAYSIVDGNVNNDFYINSKTGIIYVANKLDREEVSAYNLLVQARDSGGLASNRPVSITISDNNDQNPVFERSQYAFSIEEGAVAGRIVGRVAAFDSDSGENGQISYSLELSPTSTLDGRPLFTIDEQTGEIRVVESLDYEQARVHTLIVIAKDHGENPRSTTASVQVRVVDVQDEQPYFERYYIETRLEENLGKHRVAQVQARDPDSETQISYVLKAGDSSLFAVDAQTGIVSTIRGLDFEESRAHSLLVGTLENQESDLVAVANLLDASLSSGLTMQKSPVCRIDITVVDLNDNEPQFVSQMLPVRIQDSAQLGTVVANVSAIDRDASQPNNQVRYELVGREDPLEVAATTSDQCAQSFMIDPTSGSVSVKSDLKRDSQSECQLVIRARDLGQQPKSLSSTSSLTIFIDHIAEISHSSMIGFADSSFTVELEENSAPNSLVKILPVVNKPKINFPLSCEIVNGNELGKFYVVENELRDCELRTGKQVIDYEIKQRYTLTLRLNTIGSGAKNLAHVNINILDKNDNRPIFSQPARYSHLTANRFLAAIASDAPSETQVLQLRASDLDSAHSNGLVSYELLNDSELDGRFKVDPIDGILRTSRPVEDVPRTRLPMRLRVLARDNPEQPSDSLESVAEVIVNLIDDRHRMALALNDAPTGRVLDSKDEILSAIQERSGLISGLEKAESLKVQKNGSLESDVSGTDFWFYLIEPGTFRIVPSDDARIRNALLEPRAQNSLLDILGKTLGFDKARLRLPYSLLAASGRASSVLAQRSPADSVASALILAASIIAIISAIVVVYQCGSWSSYSRAAKEKLFFQQQQQQSYYQCPALLGACPKGAPGSQDTFASRSAFYATLAHQQPSLMPQLVGNSCVKQAQGGEPIYQLDQSSSHATFSKEYETQMLKMSVLFDDNNSVDEQNLNEHKISKNLNP